MSGIMDQSPPKCCCSKAVTKIAKDEYSSTSRCCAKQRLWSLLASHNLSNISFIVGPDSQTETFHAHKDILSVGSSVFQSMFSGKWMAESNIRVPDVDPSAFSVLLRFIYTDDAPLTPALVIRVLYTAKKYAVSVLEMQCLEFFRKNLCLENAVTLLIEAKSHCDESLAESCLKEIDSNTEFALFNDDFLRIDFAILCEILNRNTLTVSETALFDAVVRWGTAECNRKGLKITRANQKSVMEGALSLIRFPLLTELEFTHKVAQSGFLTESEQLEMYYYYNCGSIPSFKFNTTPRTLQLINFGR